MRWRYDAKKANLTEGDIIDMWLVSIENVMYLSYTFYVWDTFLANVIGEYVVVFVLFYYNTHVFFFVYFVCYFVCLFVFFVIDTKLGTKDSKDSYGFSLSVDAAENVETPFLSS